jgi:hypothetical protein
MQGTRHALLAALLTFFFLQTIVFAAGGALVTGFWLWDYDLHLKLQLAFGICLGMFFLPVLLLAVIFSERLWYRVSGAEKMVNEILETSRTGTAHSD